jgi:hypothetical protein
MKALLTAAALIAATSGAALAQEAAAVPLSSAIQFQILQWVPDADLTNLTSAQYGQIVSLFANSENLSQGSHPEGAVRAILGAQ